MSVTLRNRRGFAQNPNHVWGHCEQTEVTPFWGIVECFNCTMYRCNVCKQFICADHQREHIRTDHQECEK